MRSNYSIVKGICFILFVCICYKIYKLYTLENFSTRLQDGRSRNKYHPVNLRARFRKWKRTKPFHGKIKKVKRLVNETMWNITGKRKTF